MLFDGDVFDCAFLVFAVVEDCLCFLFCLYCWFFVICLEGLVVYGYVCFDLVVGCGCEVLDGFFSCC